MGDDWPRYWVVWTNPEFGVDRDEGPFDTWEAADEWSGGLVGVVDRCRIQLREQDGEVVDTWGVDL